MSTLTALDRGQFGTASLTTLNVSACSPATIAFGGIPVTYLTAQVVGVATAFLVMTVVLAPSLYTYAAASQHINHPAAAYALICEGLNRIIGVGAGMVAVVSYQAIHFGLYGLVGATLGATFTGVPWWGWSTLAALIIGLLGLLTPRRQFGIIAIALGLQFLVLLAVLYLNWPGVERVTLAAFSFESLTGLGVAAASAALAFTMAAFVGAESSTAFGEEARTHAIRRATMVALPVVGVFSAVIAWSFTWIPGPEGVVEAASNGIIPFGTLGRFAPVAIGALVLAMTTAMLAFHNTVSRYLLALGRERVLPRFLDRVNANGAPTAASVLQTWMALAVIGLFAALGLDPLTQFFTWLSAGAAIGVLALITACSLAATQFFHRHRRNGNIATTVFVPVLGVLFGGAALALMVDNVEVLLGGDTRVKEWIVSILIGCFVTGYLRGLYLRARRRKLYQQLGRVRPRPLLMTDRRLIGTFI